MCVCEGREGDRCVCVREEREGRTEWGWRGEGGMEEDLRKVGGRKEDGSLQPSILFFFIGSPSCLLKYPTCLSSRDIRLLGWRVYSTGAFPTD